MSFNFDWRYQRRRRRRPIPQYEVHYDLHSIVHNKPPRDPALVRLLDKYDGKIEESVITMVFKQCDFVEQDADAVLQTFLESGGELSSQPSDVREVDPREFYFNRDEFPELSRPEDYLDTSAGFVKGVDKRFDKFREAVPEHLLDSSVLQMILDENVGKPDEAVLSQISELIGYRPKLNTNKLFKFPSKRRNRNAHAYEARRDSPPPEFSTKTITFEELLSSSPQEDEIHFEDQLNEEEEEPLQDKSSVVHSGDTLTESQAELADILSTSPEVYYESAVLDQPDDADHQEDFESATDSTDSDALIFLMEMFPTLDRQTLLTKLRQNDFQLDETVNAILPLIQSDKEPDLLGIDDEGIEILTAEAEEISGSESTEASEHWDKDKFSSAHDDEEEFETKMGILKALFPNLSEDELVDHLISNNMNISVTVQQLFDATTFTPTKPKKKKKKAKTQPLEAFHREYKEQANEWDGRNNNNNNNNNDSNDGDKLDMASTIKFNEIKAMFPTVNESLLKVTFMSYGCKVEPTVNALREFGIHPQKPVEPPSSPKPSAAKENSQEEEEEEEEMLTLADIPQDVDELLRKGMEFAEARNQVFKQAALAFQTGHKRIAQELSKKGREYQAKMKEVHMLAARKMFYAQRFVIDLHGLQVQAAIDLLKQLLALHEKNNPAGHGNGKPRTLKIITGIGRHSANGKARLRPAVKQFLAGRGYHVTEVNPGLLQVTLK